MLSVRHRLSSFWRRGPASPTSVCGSLTGGLKRPFCGPLRGDIGRGVSAAQSSSAACGRDGRARAHLAGLRRSLAAATTRSNPGGARQLASRARSIEQTYQRKTPVEHVLLRPGMYIGSEKPLTDTLWLYDGRRKVISERDTRFVPGLVKIFDEILVNACDNKHRDPKGQTRIEVSIDPGDSKAGRPPRISVTNNGRGIPIALHKGEGVHVPELVLGTLMTGSNFDDEEVRLTGGRYGYGAKLTNIFSVEFSVETADRESGKLYRQTWRGNMSERTEPELLPLPKGEGDYTRVTFTPDLSRLGGGKAGALDAGTLALMRRRVMDVAGTTAGVDVYLDGELLPANTFEDYMALYRDNGPTPVYYRANASLEIGVSAVAEGAADGPASVSFVNSMSTRRGGTHVNAVVEEFVTKLTALLRKRHPSLGITPALVRRRLRVFVNCHVPNPSFDSQSKDRLDTPMEELGFKVNVPTRVVNAAAAAGGVEDAVVSALQAREDAALRRKASRARNRSVRLVPKLEDANLAGGAHASDCTLVLTEGDSAKALAVAGLAVVGRDRFGVFPLRGKLLNVRAVGLKTALANEEVSNLVTILGLDFAKKYEDVQPGSKNWDLRYGRVMIMADQDHDGSHIKGLVINLFHHYWPALLRVPGFLEAFVTPVVKARRGRGQNAETREFFSVESYDRWYASLEPAEARKWSIKYYKGLGTSTAAEGRTYFGNLEHHRREFAWGGARDDERISMAFSKTAADARKQWLLDFDSSTLAPSADVDEDVDSVPRSFAEFVDEELIHFSRADIARSIPSLVDGLKPSQRKVLFASFRRAQTAEMKVAQLAGYCAEHTAYHHGEAALHATIVKMAQDYVGSNNLPLLQPIGQFGTRLRGGRDAASARYIFTKVAHVARLLFPPVDDPLLEHCVDDGLEVEPVTYVPIIPTVLVNGAEGIGTGWSTQVPTHHPLDVIDAVRAWVEAGGDPEAPLLPKPLTPWVRGYNGSLAYKSGRGFTTTGIVGWESKSRIRITELPVGRWTDDYKEFLVRLVDQGVLRNFREHHTETRAEFELMVSKTGLDELAKDGLRPPVPNGTEEEEPAMAAARELLVTKLKLRANSSMRNMHLFDTQGRIALFAAPEDILRAYAPTRLELYSRRLKWQQISAGGDLTVTQNKLRFLNDVTSGSLDLTQYTRNGLLEELQARGYDRFSDVVPTLNRRGEVEIGSAGWDAARDFDYLIGAPVWQLTGESITAAETSVSKQSAALDALMNVVPEDVWRSELDALQDHLEKDPTFAARPL